ncbi:MAG: DUF411 domain-containing protein [Elainellaceae cyanobacterium]
MRRLFSQKKWGMVVVVGIIASTGAIALYTAKHGFGHSSTSHSMPTEQETAASIVSIAKTSTITVYRSPSCGCCGGWIDHMEAQGFRVDDQLTDDLDSIKRNQGVPEQLASCHTSVVNGYVIEGHVPVADVQRLLIEQPNIAGIAVPGMPLGTPGMEAGDIQEPFSVFSFKSDGAFEVFQDYSS